MANTIELKQQIQQGAYDAAFVKLYGADVDVNAQRKRYILPSSTSSRTKFGSGRSVRLYSAPAAPRSAATTDHNNGVVLAGSVNLDIVAVVSPTRRTSSASSPWALRRSTMDVTNLVPQEQEGALRCPDPRRGRRYR